jgi:CheY-like chemotaxis protein
MGEEDTMSQKTILVADDEAPIREIFEEFYRQAGYVVKTAENGEQALAILEQESIEVMFLDLDMPRMGGIEVCRKIRKSNPIACIYAVTGNAILSELAACREAGFDDYFTKPVDGKMLVKAAEDAFEKMDRWNKLG